MNGTISQCEIQEVITCNKKDTVLELARKFKETGVRNITVVENNVPIGIVSTSDVVARIVAEGKDAGAAKVEDIMVSPVFVVHKDEELKNAMMAMVKKGINCCPVIDKDDKCVGTVTLYEVITKLKA